MNLFENLIPTAKSKKKSISLASLLCDQAKSKGLKLNENREFLENLCIEKLEYLISQNKKKYNKELIKLWAFLDMQTYLDSYYELIINPYLGLIPIKELDYYPVLEVKQLNLLDVKIIEKLQIENVKFEKLYMATFDIRDAKYKAFRPYVELYVQENGNFRKIGFGYDTNDNKSVELFIDNFAYAVFLSSKGIISLPLKSKKIKLYVYDIITDESIEKITSSLNSEELEF